MKENKRDGKDRNQHKHKQLILKHPKSRAAIVRKRKVQKIVDQANRCIKLQEF